MRFQVLPKSAVRAMYGVKSPERCESNETYAVPRDAALATTRPTYVPLAIPAPDAIAALTSFQVFPPSIETCTLPSSDPTHSTLGSSGDSAIVVISLNPDSPSLREILMSRPRTPMSGIVSRFTWRVRSGVAVHVEPRSFEMKSRLPPRYTVPGVWRDATSGESQSHRYAESPLGGCGLMSRRSPVAGSKRCTLAPLDEVYTVRQSALSTACPVPSENPISTQSWFKMPSQCRVALGPVHEWLSCR